METLKEKLKIDSLLKEQNLDNALKELAETLMNDYCVYNGYHQYRPIEIEFYIYDKKNHPDRNVYLRDKKAGELFFHYSGMDICFESLLPANPSSDEDVRFGGILIRALERDSDDKQLFGGPLICVNEVLNNASEMCKIDIIRVQKKETKKEAKVFGRRVGINGEDNYSKAQYRFVRKDILERINHSKENPFSRRDYYDLDNYTIKTKPSSYKIIEYTPKK